ncbi:MAG: phosphomethylpyrimidine synthase ThiC [Elusimicrobiota bacterium]
MTDKYIEKICEQESISPEELMKKKERGKVVIPLNNKRKDINIPTAIGEGLKVKINANIGGSPDISNIKEEINKLKIAVKYGADTVMDLTIGKDWQAILTRILKISPVPVGTVPVYAAVCKEGKMSDLKPDEFIDIIQKQGEMGVDFMTVHSGVTRQVAQVYDESNRLGGIVSRGGKLLYRWMKKNDAQNPLYENFDRIMDIAKKYDITLSLGDGLRPGCLADASDAPQYEELSVLGELTRRCREKGVQVMIEGPGHVPLDKIEENVKREKELCDSAPFYVLGPLTTDLGAGYDHITGAIGGALAAWKGADYLCYVTPAEHLHLPENDDVKRGVIASKIAAHSADIARGLDNIRDGDDKISVARKNLDWDKMEKYALDPETVKKTKQKFPQRDDRACTMCGEYCALLED